MNSKQPSHFCHPSLVLRATGSGHPLVLTRHLQGRTQNTHLSYVSVHTAVIWLLEQGLHPLSLTSAVSALDHCSSSHVEMTSDPTGRTQLAEPCSPEFPRHLFKLPQSLGVQEEGEGKVITTDSCSDSVLVEGIQNSWGSFWTSPQICRIWLSEMHFRWQTQKDGP